MVKQELLRTKNILSVLFRERKIKLDRVVFFGSQVTSKAGKDSDIDIIAVSKNFRGKDIFAKIEMANGISAALVKVLHKPVDLLYYSDKEWESGSSIIMNTAKHEGLVFSK